MCTRATCTGTRFGTRFMSIGVGGYMYRPMSATEERASQQQKTMGDELGKGSYGCIHVEREREMS